MIYTFNTINYVKQSQWNILKKNQKQYINPQKIYYNNENLKIDFKISVINFFQIIKIKI